MNTLIRILKKATESYLVIVIISLTLAFLFDEHLVKLGPYKTIYLGIIFFLSALKIDMKKVFAYLGDVKMVAVAVTYMLIAFPALVYVVTDILRPDLAIAFLLLAAMPAGMTAPLLAELAGGRQSLALVIAVVSSLLAPVTVPIVIKLLAGTRVDVSFLSMFLDLAKVIFIPFLIAQVIKWRYQKIIDRYAPAFTPISVIFLALIIIAAVSKQADRIIDGLRSGESVTYLAALFILFIAFHLIGYFTFFWKEGRDRVTLTVALTYMNFTLAIVLADKYFPEPSIVVPVVLAILPWTLFLTPFRMVMRRLGNIA